MIAVFVSVPAYATHVEAKVLYFQPTEQAFKDIYGSGMSYGGEFDINIFDGLAIWIGAEYFTKKGELTFTKEETELQITPIYGGLKYIFPGRGIMPYLGAGVGYFQYKETNPIGTVKEGKIGFVTQAGLLVRLLGPVLVDFQVGYNMCKIKPQEIEAQIGGLKAGVGLGFSF
jgi:opacity protein-like surface antigen